MIKPCEFTIHTYRDEHGRFCRRPSITTIVLTIIKH